MSKLLSLKEHSPGPTPEGRERLAEAMRKRWAAKRLAAKKATNKR